MTHCRLNNLFLLYIHTTITDATNLDEVAKDFISVNPRRINGFGNIYIFFCSFVMQMIIQYLINNI